MKIMSHCAMMGGRKDSRLGKSSLSDRGPE